MSSEDTTSTPAPTGSSAGSTPEDPAEITVETLSAAPDRELVRALEELARAAEEADGNPPFSEQTLIELQKADSESSADDSRLRLAVAHAWPDGEDGEDGDADRAADGAAAAPLLAGAGVVVRGDEESPDVLEMVVRPNCRQHGVGGRLASALESDALSPAAGRTRRAWAHGEHEAAVRLASRFAWRPVRELWRMRLTAPQEVSVPEPPQGVRIRAFEPGRDEEAWLRANAAAFVDHPEQGRLTREDLEARMAEEWFDPAGFLLAEEDGQLLGFHWTKVHPADPAEGRHEPVGEVYVVGVVPEAQGRGLGRVLTLAGIEHLRSRGLGAIMLYTDADNTPAVQLYTALGFARWNVDTMYAPAEDAPSPDAGRAS